MRGVLGAPRACLVLLLAAGLCACASRPVVPYERPAPQYSQAPRADDAFAGIEAAIGQSAGPDASGFELLDTNEEALRWRLALIDSARHTIDVQYYVWFGDAAGRLLLKRVLDAADRGVQVRLLLDDLNTVLKDAATVEQRDELVAWVDSHPNVQVRLFNPWRDRALFGRIGESLQSIERVNHRMHNKALIVDNRATILGGRNIGDEYMGLNAEFNFHDLDVLAVGPVARQASAVFDLFWNSEWVMPVTALKLPVTPEQRAESRTRLAKRVATLPALERFPPEPQSWSAEIAALPGRLMPGRSSVETDKPDGSTLRQDMIHAIYREVRSTRRELVIVNAYIIPDDYALKTLAALRDRGVQVTILTNSLASHDVPAVNSHYKGWRRPLLEAGVTLHEIRHDAAIQPLVADTPPVRAKFMGLHSKAMVMDRERCFVGSMNFDPRSAAINTEMGVLIDSPAVCGALAKLIDRDRAPANAWRVEVDGERLKWVNDRETVTTQPARSWWQRVEDVVFMAFPKAYY
jgi:putative cardiolipin synthase